MSNNRVAVTSIQAYYSDKERLDTTVKERIYDTIKDAMMPSSSDISRLTSISRTTVTARLRELEDESRIYKAGTKMDPFTKHKVTFYKITERKGGARWL